MYNEAALHLRAKAGPQSDAACNERMNRRMLTCEFVRLKVGMSCQCDQNGFLGESETDTQERYTEGLQKGPMKIRTLAPSLTVKSLPAGLWETAGPEALLGWKPYWTQPLLHSISDRALGA